MSQIRFTCGIDIAHSIWFGNPVDDTNRCFFFALRRSSHLIVPFDWSRRARNSRSGNEKKVAPRKSHIGRRRFIYWITLKLSFSLNHARCVGARACGAANQLICLWTRHETLDFQPFWYIEYITCNHLVSKTVRTAPQISLLYDCQPFARKYLQYCDL